MASSDPGELSPIQQETLEQYMQVTNQMAADALPVLRSCHWNVQAAVSHFFDGGPAAETVRPPIAPHTETLLPQYDSDSDSDVDVAAHDLPHLPPTSLAPRVVLRPPVVREPPHWLLAMLFVPFHLVWRLAASVADAVAHVLELTPWPLGNGRAAAAAAATATATGLGSTADRRSLMPRDAAARFHREFDEQYGANELPFHEDGFAQAHDRAKAACKFLLIVLVSPEHDETEAFARDILLSAEFVTFVNDPLSRLVLWAGNVLDPEALQVAREYNCTGFPFVALACITPREGDGADHTRMGVIKRLVGTPASPDAYVAGLRDAMGLYAADLDILMAERASLAADRRLRVEQDVAYERALAADTERARVRRETEQAARDLEARRLQWRRWKASLVAAEPSASEPGVVRLILNVPEAVGGPKRLVRRFAAHTTLHDLYAFVECHDLHVRGGEAPDDRAEPDEKEEHPPSRPDGYVHDFRFRIFDIMPRVAYLPSETLTVGDAIGKSGNLIIEAIEDGQESGDE